MALANAGAVPFLNTLVNQLSNVASFDPFRTVAARAIRPLLS